MIQFRVRDARWRLGCPPLRWLARGAAGLAFGLACLGAGCGEPGFDLNVAEAARAPDSKTGQSRFRVTIKPKGAAADKSANGFLYQKVIFDFQVYKCQDCDCETFKSRTNPNKACSPVFVKRIVYVEAWELSGGTLYHGLKSNNNKDPQDTFDTDDFSVERKMEICGVISISGEMKFVSGKAPAELDPAQWKASDKAVQSGLLPSTLAVAPVRAFDALNGKTVVKDRELRTRLDSCGSPDMFRGTLVVNKPLGSKP